MSHLDASWRGYYLYRLGGALVPLLPPAVTEALAIRLGDLSYWLDAKSRENVRDNLRHVLGHSASPTHVDTVARAVHRNITRNYFALFRVPHLSLEELRSRVKIEGLDGLREALALGRGAVVASAHFGNTDTVMHVFAGLGLSVLAPAEHLRPEAMYRYMCRLRGTFGVRFLPVDEPLTELARHLKRGGIVAMALDRDTTNSGLHVSFFGAPARLPDGAVQMSLRMKAPLVFGIAYRLEQPRGHHRLELERVELPQTGDRQADVAAGVQHVARILERRIARAPEQWVMTTPVWKM